MKGGENTNLKSKIVYGLWLSLLSAFLIVAVLSGAFFWQQRINWTVEDTSFSVTDENGVAWTSPYNLTGVTVDSMREFFFVVTNVGNVNINVSGADVTPIVNGTAVWNATQLSNIMPGQNQTFLLAITFLDSGYYEFKFESTKA